MRTAFDHKPRLTSRASIGVLLACALAALCALGIHGSSASADLQSKLNAKQHQLGRVQHIRGVLTTTISHFTEQITGLQNEVAALQNREAAVQQRLDAKQA